MVYPNREVGESKSSAGVPRLTESVDIKSLPIDPFEGFMLSRIDGLLTAQEVADSTGAEVSQVVDLVDRLSKLGAAVWLTEAERPVVVEPRMSQPPPRIGSANTARIHTRPPPPGTSLVLYNPAELEEDVDLPVERRREILDRYYRLEELDYYQLLGLPRSAEKKDIRDAYFGLSKLFHPDTLFGKKLGSYQQKMELVFGALTKAYEVLGKKRKRKDYDFYLGLTDTTSAAEQGLADAEVKAEAVEKESLEAASAAVVMPSTPGVLIPSSPPSSPSSSPSSPRRPTPPPRSTSDRKARARERLKHRFLRASDSSQAPEPAPPSSSPPSVERTREDLLRGLAGSLRSAAQITGGIDKGAEHVRMGKEAEERGDLLQATNAYRMALSIDDSPTNRALYERVRSQLSADLAENYIKQAKYEEANEKWGAAALSWKKVSEGRPHSAEPLYKAANAILMSGGDLKHARDLAQRAVDLMPGSKKPRVILARIYMGAGMQKSASHELREAAKLDPSDEIVKTLLRDLE